MRAEIPITHLEALRHIGDLYQKHPFTPHHAIELMTHLTGDTLACSYGDICLIVEVFTEIFNKDDAARIIDELFERQIITFDRL
jgi:hypothetical protein